MEEAVVILTGSKSGLKDLCIYPLEDVFHLSVLIAVHCDRKLTSGYIRINILNLS